MTLNRTEAIDPAKVLRTISYAHPVFTPEGARAQARHEEISGRNRTHYAGAYWRWGFHEDGVASAVRVAERFGGAPVSEMYAGDDPASPLRRARRTASSTGSRWPTRTCRRRRRATTSATAPSRNCSARAVASIRLLTMPRSLGVGFNPVSFYYGFDEDGELLGLVAEVTNTPWGERHAYALPRGGGSVDKDLHVSPFMGMDHAYDVRASVPGETALGAHREPPRRRSRLRRDAQPQAPPATRAVACSAPRCARSSSSTPTPCPQAQRRPDPSAPSNGGFVIQSFARGLACALLRAHRVRPAHARRGRAPDASSAPAPPRRPSSSATRASGPPCGAAARAWPRPTSTAGGTRPTSPP